MPSRFELVAHERTEEEISAVIGADLVIFQTLPDLIASCSQFNPSITDFDCSVFTGQYVTGGVDEDYLAGLETMRSDNAKIKANGGMMTVEQREKEVDDDNRIGREEGVGCSGPMNGADDNISQVVGLSNAERFSNASVRSQSSDRVIGLSNLGDK